MGALRQFLKIEIVSECELSERYCSVYSTAVPETLVLSCFTQSVLGKL